MKQAAAFPGGHIPEEKDVVSYKAPLMYIAGEWTKGSGKPKDVINPATEEVLAQLPGATEADLDRALESTQRGFKVWSGLSAEARCDIVMKGCQILRERAAEIAPHIITSLTQPRWPMRKTLPATLLRR